MNQDLDQIEEELKEEADFKKKTHKVSGRSVFKLQEIIKNKSSVAKAVEDKAGDEGNDEKEKSPQEN